MRVLPTFCDVDAMYFLVGCLIVCDLSLLYLRQIIHHSAERSWMLENHWSDMVVQYKMYCNTKYVMLNTYKVSLRQVFFSFEHYFQHIQNTWKDIKCFRHSISIYFKTNNPALIKEKLDVRKSLSFYGRVQVLPIFCGVDAITG